MKMDDPSAFDINARIAARVRELRAGLGLSLEALAARSGVSRSALSLIERAETSPTATVLDRLAAGLGVTLSALFEPATAELAASPLVARDAQPLWRDPASGYLRRAVSPPGVTSPLRIVEIEFPAGARVAYDVAARDPVVHQQIWMFEGTVVFTHGEHDYRLVAGDCLAVKLDVPTGFHNPTRKRARYAVVTATEPGGRR